MLLALRRIEYLAIGIAAWFAYGQTGASWWLFTLAILAPDISMLGYLGGPKIGAFCYNAAHSWLVPIGLLASWWFFDSPLLLAWAFIWIAHIGFDRALGFGLKYASGFKDTHLGQLNQL